MHFLVFSASGVTQVHSDTPWPCGQQPCVVCCYCCCSV